MAEPCVQSPTLLGRAELVEGLGPALKAMAGLRILITGAGGSLGRLMAAQLVSARDVRLVLLDHHDHSLFALQRELADRGGQCRFVLADVRETERIGRLLRAERPDLVLHLAAYKHVHFGEQFPEETVAVNVLATRALMRAAEQAEVERFVYPSRDKAVNPPSLYGATKRIGEVLIAEAGVRGRAYAAVRFMNVLGTRGSVLETFAAQVASGAPLAVTDARMSRYWISQREAIWLMLSAAHAPAGSLHMLDVPGEIPVVEMAQRLARCLGAAPAPYPMAFTGMRPGERLREELLGPHEHVRPGPTAGLVRVADERLSEHVEAVDGLVDNLAELCEGEGGPALRQATMEAAGMLQ
jgi:FlaA1/EpsC-like NDP-sugar epimerase